MMLTHSNFNLLSEQMTISQFGRIYCAFLLVHSARSASLDAFLEINTDLKKALTVPPASRRTPAQRIMFVNCENLEWTDHGLLIARRGTDQF